MNRRIALPTALALLCACGGDDLGDGRAQALIKDLKAATSYSGTLGGNMQVSISEDGTNWFNLGSLNGITIVLQSNTDSTNAHGEQTTPAGNYTRVRLTIRDAEVTINTGSTVGGTTLTSARKLTPGGSDGVVVIEKALSFEVVASTTSRTTILFDLNSEQWVTEAALQAGVVEDQPMQQAATVTARRDS